MDRRLRTLRLNSALSLGYQVLLIVTGLLLPRFFLKYYGSEVYGLVSSIAQFLSFVNICDLGIGAVVSSALFRPLAEKNYEVAGRIVATAKKFFRIVSAILLVYIGVLALVYPHTVADTFDHLFTVSLLLAMSVSTFGQYFLGAAYQLLINADQKYYVQLLINGGTLILNTGACIFLMCTGNSIQVVKLATSLIYLLRPVLLWLYVRKNYPFAKGVKGDWSLIPQKTNGIVQHISYTVYENTDVAVLTIFSTLANVAVYSVYYLIVNSIRTLLNAMTSSIVATFGNLIAKEEGEQLQTTYHVYDWFLHTGGTLFFVVTYILIVPFVMIYTRGVSDADYRAPLFAGLLVLAFFVNTLRVGMHNIIKAAGHYRQTQWASLAEAVLNIGLSVAFVFRFGLIGVAVGTLASTTFFTVYEVFYLSKNILFRSPLLFFRSLLIDAGFVAASLLAMHFVPVRSDGYFSWMLSALLVFVICLVICVLFQLVFHRREAKRFLGFLCNR